MLVNRERVGERSFLSPRGFDFDASHEDIFLQGECDDVVEALVEELGWKVEFRELREELAKQR